MNIESIVEDFYNVPNKLRKHKNQIKMNYQELLTQTEKKEILQTKLYDYTITSEERERYFRLIYGDQYV